MSCEAFIAKRFSLEATERIDTSIRIIETYTEMGLRLTLRQLFYQHVAHHGLPNSEKSYKGLGKLISDARLAGLIDWEAIEDRGRQPDVPAQWESIESLVDIASRQFRLPRWASQNIYVELWVEKQALAGVLEPVAHKHHVTLMVNKGYSSQSAMYASAERIREQGKDECVVLYLGDHDPSGEDMVRDIRERLAMFLRDDVALEVYKVALTLFQIRQYDPPPNPAKITDPRAAAYIQKFGDESWEVDALDPPVLVALIESAIRQHIDSEALEDVLEDERAQKDKLKKALAKVKW